MEEAHQGGSPTPTGSRTPPFLVGEGKRRSRTPPFLVGVGEKERGGEEQGKVGCTPCPIQTRGGAQASFLLASLLYSCMAQ